MTSFKQAAVWWCYKQVGVAFTDFVRAAAAFGYQGIELPDPEHYPIIKEHGLEIVTLRGHDSIPAGLNRRANHARIEREIRDNLEVAVKWSVPNLICFSGNRDGLDDAMGQATTIEGLQRVARFAEDAGVTLVMELLNSKVDHPDYQFDRMAWGVGVCERVASPHVKILYDLYHAQVMEGDLIRTLRTHHAWIGHYHTAGNPGRHELDDTQELNYVSIMRAIADTGFTGYVGQEFVPIGEPLAALRAAYTLCHI
jgi:hydroxypyruvate isomerase